MSARLLFALLFGIAAIARASDNSVEVTLELTPQDEHAQTSFRRWTFRPQPDYQDSDSHFPQWEYKFKAGSDKALGTAADTTAIGALVPSSMPVTIRWVSRHVVVVAADCFSTLQSGSGFRCLYVLEKHGAKWKVTHHYAHHWHFPTI